MTNRKSVSSILVTVLILAGYYLLFGARTSKAVSLNFTDTQMTVSGPEGYIWQCELSDIENLALIDELDAGTCVDGRETEDYRLGIWHNTSYGDYQVCASRAIPSYVVVSTRDHGIFLFNYETAANTQELYHSFVKMLEQDKE
ncbi:MAG: hypothetical protein ACI4PO_07440 [Faecousia sp.]